MWSIVRRAILPTLLLIGGSASLIYGAFFRSVPVLKETETEMIIEVPAAFLPDQSFDEPPLFPDDEPPMDESPPMVQEVVKRIDLVTIVESEPALMRELSVGGVTLLESGKLKRTYSGDKGPTLCPS